MIRDCKKGNLIGELKCNSEGITSVCFFPDGSRIVTGSSDGLAVIWNAKDGTKINELKGHSDIKNVNISPNGKRIVTVSE